MHRVSVSIDRSVAQVVRESLDVANIRADGSNDLGGPLAGDDLGELGAEGVLEDRGGERDTENRAGGAEKVGDSGRSGHVLGLNGRDEGDESDGDDSSVSSSESENTSARPSNDNGEKRLTRRGSW